MSRIGNPSLLWRDGDLPFSQGFDDVYYSPQNGMAETETVFLGGNRLPENWEGKRQFTIAETGFGTGLNFLAAWKKFEETATPDQRLDFISVEQFPLHKDDLKRALKNWENAIDKKYIDRFLEIYPMRIPGFHRRWVTPQVTLTLIFDEALRGLSQLDAQVDAWFLDGFAPKKNPDMWKSDLFLEIARLSHDGTTLGSFTAAGDVRRGLAAVGFKITRVDGFRYKYHRTVGMFQSDKKKVKTFLPSVTILGAGLGGAALYHCLKRRGINATVIDPNGIANGASSNRLGLLNPKLEAQDNPRNDAGTSAFSFARHILSETPDCDFNPCGALHLAHDDDKAERLENFLRRNSWLTPHMKWIPADETENICGIDLKYDGLFYADAGTVNTKKFVEKMLSSVTLSDKPQGDIIIHATGIALRDKFKLQPVRGQVTTIKAPQNLKCPIMFGHYIAPSENLWFLGASFEQNNDNPELKSEDTQKNITEAQNILGQEINAEIVSEWAQVRTASRDRFPICGKVNENEYVLGALGSHGIQFSLLMAEIIACELTGAPSPLGLDARHVLSSNRFNS
jgi:tRNA 5-methylaminomethyl-2-thiouridine biosynthesis bifunctional protein